MRIFTRLLGKLWNLSTDICRGFVRKICSIFFRRAHPLLPLQNPASTSTITEPLLLHTPPLISSSTTLDDDDDQHLVCEDRVLRCQEDIFKCQIMIDHHVAASNMVPVFLNENETPYLKKEEEEEMKRRQKKEEKRKEKEKEKEKEREEKEKEKEKEEKIRKEEEKGVIVVCEERWIKHYSSRHRILLVGEGNFSFSVCLASTFRYASNIIATSLDSKAFLKEHYLKALSNIEELRSRGSTVLHGIDATTMANHHLLRLLKFDRIVFNFPYAGLRAIKKLSRQTQLEHHRRLVRQFMENAREMISEEGEIHITHKTNGFHAEWRVESIARGQGLRLIEAVDFKLHWYPGYDTKCGFGGNDNFDCYPCKTYKFGFPAWS